MTFNQDHSGNEATQNQNTGGHIHKTSYSGLGPRCYQRSSTRIEEEINERLTRDAYIDASDIDITIEQDRVLLEGHVKDAYAKQHAERIAAQVHGVHQVENRLHILTDNHATSASGQADHPTIISEANAATRSAEE
jgi:osmotically-inducible protein OsmY